VKDMTAWMKIFSEKITKKTRFIKALPSNYYKGNCMNDLTVEVKITRTEKNGKNATCKH
jgi:hypothetical protein